MTIEVAGSGSRANIDTFSETQWVTVQGDIERQLF